MHGRQTARYSDIPSLRRYHRIFPTAKAIILQDGEVLAGRYGRAEQSKLFSEKAETPPEFRGRSCWNGVPGGGVVMSRCLCQLDADVLSRELRWIREAHIVDLLDPERE